MAILDDCTRSLGAAARWRLGESIKAFARELERRGSRLLLRSGQAGDVLASLIAETGARAVYWSRTYDPAGIARDSEVKATFQKQGIDARGFDGHLLREPWLYRTQSGGPYKVFTPFWKKLRNGGDLNFAIAGPPDVLPSPKVWPETEALPHWGLEKGVNRGGVVLARHKAHEAGEAGALERLSFFIEQSLTQYSVERDFLGRDGCSQLSEALSYGEISVRRCWAYARNAQQLGNAEAEAFLRQLAWREFAYHLLYYTPQMCSQCWRSDWEGFTWRHADSEGFGHDLQAWQRGCTGIDVVDAAMRQLYVTGRMHNRARMIVASYLTKHLLIDWRYGRAWFDACLTDYDPACNALGWQWVAGCGPDAAPFFRIINPVVQAERYDSDASYQQRWLEEEAADYFAAVPLSWDCKPTDRPSGPIMPLAEGRMRALMAYETFKYGAGMV